jgi:hypothetical protein
MKIAICLHGLASGFNDKGVPVSFEEGIESLKQNVFGDHDVDIFFHTWSEDSEKDLVERYNPKKYLVEKQIIFKHPYGIDSTQYSFTPDIQTKLQSTYSRWYSLDKCISLKKEEEDANDFKYDFVLALRFDMVFYDSFIKFENLNPNVFYVSNWWHNRFNFGYNDPWFITGSENADKVGNLYDNINSYLAEDSDYEKYLMSLREISPREAPERDNKISNHGLLRWHVKTDEIESGFIGLEYNSWSLIRKIPHGRTNPYFPRGFPFPLDQPLPEDRACTLAEGPRGAGW